MRGKKYKAHTNIYDNTITQNKWWSKIYIRLFWNGVNDIEIADRILSMLPEQFSGKMLDVPADTAVLTAEKYLRLPEAEIVCMDYSNDMPEQA